MTPDEADRAELLDAIEVFFAAFTSGPQCHERVARLRALFLPGAVIVRTCGPEPAVYGVEEFLVPRERMLTDGTLVGFREWPTEGRFDVFGDVAHWFGSYAKDGRQAGEPYAGRGRKSVQFVRTAAGWRISAAAWDDERPGVRLPDGAEFVRQDLSGARFRMVDLSRTVMRAVDLTDAAIDGDIGGLTINGVDVGAAVEAELVRRHPARALRRSPEPEGLRACWAALEQGWERTYARVAALPAATVDVSVDGEWTFAQTLRHLVFATDAWLGSIRGDERPFHPWGVPFSSMSEFLDRTPAELGIDTGAAPTYAEVLGLRAERVAAVRAFLAGVTPERLAEECGGPPWEAGERFTVLRCLWVIMNEECEHLRYAERDLDLIEAAGE